MYQIPLSPTSSLGAVGFIPPPQSVQLSEFTIDEDQLYKFEKKSVKLQSCSIVQQARSFVESRHVVCKEQILKVAEKMEEHGEFLLKNKIMEQQAKSSNDRQNIIKHLQEYGNSAIQLHYLTKRMQDQQNVLSSDSKIMFGDCWIYKPDQSKRLLFKPLGDKYPFLNWAFGAYYWLFYINFKYVRGTQGYFDAALQAQMMSVMAESVGATQSATEFLGRDPNELSNIALARYLLVPNDIVKAGQVFKVDKVLCARTAYYILNLIRGVENDVNAAKLMYYVRCIEQYNSQEAYQKIADMFLIKNSSLILLKNDYNTLYAKLGANFQQVAIPELTSPEIVSLRQLGVYTELNSFDPLNIEDEYFYKPASVKQEENYISTFQSLCKNWAQYEPQLLVQRVDIQTLSQNYQQGSEVCKALQSEIEKAVSTNNAQAYNLYQAKKTLQELNFYVIQVKQLVQVGELSQQNNKSQTITEEQLQRYFNKAIWQYCNENSLLQTGVNFTVDQVDELKEIIIKLRRYDLDIVQKLYNVQTMQRNILQAIKTWIQNAEEALAVVRALNQQ